MQPALIETRSREALLEQWRELLRLRREVLKTSDIEAIHDLRVSSRRFRAALGLFEPWLPPKSAALLKKSIRKVTGALGALRNIDEALLFFRLHTPAESVSGYQLRYILTQMRGGELARIEKALKDFDHHRLNRMVRKATTMLEEDHSAAGKTFSLPTYFSDTCIKLYQPIQELLPVATSREHREPRHVLRIAIKKWRYFFEIAAPVLECDCSSILDLLKEYQTILGRMNDVAEFGVLCGRLALSRREHTFIETTLQVEDELLLLKLTELIAQKPLTYTCLS
ncbi:MAG: CHAD domain-containing protein [Proteobacteria bacterium]|nr:CHAD domain-containing protein [Pseudomonadota bacterium]